MAGLIGDIIAYVGVNDANFARQMDATVGKAEAAGRKINAALNVALVAGAAAFTAAAVAASKFEKDMANVNTLMSITDEKFQEMNDDMLRLAATVPTSISSLTKGLYDLVSAGAPAGTAVESLSIAAKAAAAGLTGVDVAVRAGMATINAYGKSMDELTTVYDLQFSTVRYGVLTYEQLANSIGTVLPAAKNLNVSLEDIYGSLAFLTKAGQSAEMATTNMARAFQQFVESKEKMAEMGIAVFDASGKFRGMEAVIGDLAEKVKGLTDEQKINKLELLDFEIRAARALTSMINNYEGFSGTLRDVSNSADAMNDAFDKQMNTFSAQAGILRNVVQTAFIDVGQSILNSFTPVLKMLNQHPIVIQGMIKSVTELAIVLGSLAAAVKVYNLAATAMGKATLTSYAAFGPIALAIGGMVTAYIAVSNAIEMAQKKRLEEIRVTSDYVNEIERLGRKYLELNEIDSKTAVEQERLDNITERLLETYKKAGIEVDKLTESFVRGAGSAKEVAETLKSDLEEQLKRVEEQIAKNTKGMEENAMGMAYASFWMKLLGKDTKTLEEQQEALKKEIAELTPEMKKQIDAEELLKNLHIETTTQINNSIIKVKEAIEVYKDDENVKRQLEERLKSLEERLKGQIDKTSKLAEQQKALKDAGVQLTSELEDEIASLERLKVAYQDDDYAVMQLNEKIATLEEKLRSVRLQAIEPLSMAITGMEQPIGNIRTNFENIVPPLADTEQKTKELTDTVRESNKDWAEYAQLIETIIGKMTALPPVAQKVLTVFVELSTKAFDPLTLSLGLFSVALDAFVSESPNVINVTEDMRKLFGEDLVNAFFEAKNSFTEFRDEIITSSPLLDEYNNRLAILEQRLITQTISHRNMIAILGEETPHIKRTKEEIAALTEEIEKLMEAFKLETEFDKVIDNLDFLAVKAVEMKGYFGEAFDISGLETLILEGIEAGKELLEGLEPGTQAYKDLQMQIWEAEAALAVLRGEVETTAEWFEMMGIEIEDADGKLKNFGDTTNKFTELGIRSEKSIWDNIDALLEFARVTDLTDYELDQVQKKLIGLYDELDLTDEQIFVLIADLEEYAIQMHLAGEDTGWVNDLIEYLNSLLPTTKKNFSDVNDEIRETNELFDLFRELGIKSEQSILDNIDALMDLAMNYDLTDYELSQVMDKIKRLYSELGLTDEQIMGLIGDWEDYAVKMHNAGKETDWINDIIAWLYSQLPGATDKIEDTNEELEDLGINFDNVGVLGKFFGETIEDENEELELLSNQLKFTNEDLEDLGINFDNVGVLGKFFGETIEDENEELELLRKQLKFTNDELDDMGNHFKNVSDDVTQFGEDIETLTDDQLEDLNKEIAGPSGKIEHLEKLGGVFRQVTEAVYDNGESVNDLLDDMGNLDEEIAGPGGKVDDLNSMGNALDDVTRYIDDASDSIRDLVDDCGNLNDEIENLTIGVGTTTRRGRGGGGGGGTEAKVEVNEDYERMKLVLTYIMADLKTIMDTLIPGSEFHKTLEDLAIEIFANVGDLVPAFSEIFPQFHAGGLVDIVKAHAGKLLEDEMLALMRQDEYVIRPETTRQFTKPQWDLFNVTANPAVFTAEGGQEVSSGDVNVTVLVHNPGPDTWAEVFKEEGEKWYRSHEKYKSKVVNFR